MKIENKKVFKKNFTKEQLELLQKHLNYIKDAVDALQHIIDFIYNSIKEEEQ